MLLIRRLHEMAVVALCLCLLAGQAFAEEAFVAGKDYTVLAKPVPTIDPLKIEVVELFWYGCPHCFDFNPLIEKWAASQADDVDFILLPSTGGAAAKVQARAFYTAQALGRLNVLHQVMFETLIRDRKPLNDEASVKSLFVANGVDAALFDKAFNSVGIGTKVEAAHQRAVGYQSRYVPALIVNGKFRIDAGEAGSFTRMLAITDYLVARERSQ